MSDGLKLLAAIVDNGSVSALRELDEALLLEDERRALAYIRQHYRRYRALPDIRTVETDVALRIPDPTEPPAYYLQKIRDRHLYEQMRDGYTRLKTCLRNYDMGAAREVIDLLSTATRHATTGRDLLTLGESTSLVVDAYDVAHQNPGISGIPTGWGRFDNITGGYQKADLITWVGRPSMGKCMDPSTPVLRHDGQVCRIDALQVGDMLMGPDSLSRTVLSTTTGREEMFEVVPARGEKWRCNLSHVLVLVCGKDLDTVHRKGGRYTYSVEAFLALPLRVRSAMRLWRTGVDFPSTTVPLDPYFVGLWLGDGTVDAPHVSTTDVPVVKYLAALAAQEGLRLVQRETREGACPVYSLSGTKGAPNFLLDFVRHRCYKNGSKRIPDMYKINDRRVRLSVLAGLIDSDGYNYGTGYEVVTEYWPLAEDILYLARSLGFGATWTYKYVNGTEYYRIRIMGCGLDQVPCLLERKRMGSRASSREVVNSSFTLRSLGEGDYFGITLSGDSLYLLGDFTVTHNTTLLLSQAWQAWMAGYSVLCVTMEMSIEQITRRMLALPTGINPSLIRRGMLSVYAEERLRNVIESLSGTSRFHMFSGGLKKKTSDVELLAQEYTPDIVLCDGVYLMQPSARKSMSKVERASDLFDELKQMTLTQNVPLVVTSQFNRQAGKKGKDGSLENIAYTDAISTHSSIVVAINSHDDGDNKRLLTFLKGREGESGAVGINYIFTPPDFSELAADDPQLATGSSQGLDWMVGR